jgi:RNA polymerase sigma-70 factor, ECF subfamily
MNEIDFEIIFKSRFSSLCNLAFTVVKNADVAKDVVQQVFMKLWHKREDLNIQGTIEAYLYRMVINTALNHIEKEKKYTRLETTNLKYTDLAETLENTSSVEDREHKVRKAIKDLPPQCQTVFSLSRFEDLSNKEIAGHLGISVKAVEKHITIALKTLRIKLLPLMNSELEILILFLMVKLFTQQVGFWVFCLS